MEQERKENRSLGSLNKGRGKECRNAEAPPKNGKETQILSVWRSAVGIWSKGTWASGYLCSIGLWFLSQVLPPGLSASCARHLPLLKSGEGLSS